MPATILAPLSGDTVSNPVAISYSYTFTSVTNVTCYVGADHDMDTPLNGGPAIGGGSVTVTVPLPTTQSVAVKAGATTLDHQDNVHITSGPPPIGIGGITVMRSTSGSSTTKTFVINGKCDPNVTPDVAFVVCYGIEIDPSTKTRTPVVVGFDVPKGATKTWKVSLTIKMDSTMVYCARAFLFDVEFNQLGSFTKALS